MEPDGVVARAFDLVAIAEVAREPAATFSAAEHAYARSKADPERRLAARLAAKRAAARLLDVALGDVEVTRGPGRPPALHLSEAARARLDARGAERALVSLTHSRRHAAALVVLVREP